jgi:asparagine synthase (glutamine-hydrolysing)
MVFDTVIPDEERHYAGLVSRALDIPITYLSLDEYTLYDGWDRPELQTPQPCNGTYRLAYYDLLRRAGMHGRVVLTGSGGDPLLMGGWAPYTLNRLKSGRWGRLIFDLWQSVLLGCYPKLRLGKRLLRLFGPVRPSSALPSWVNPQLAARVDLVAMRSDADFQTPPPTCPRPDAWRSLAKNPYWADYFESIDPGTTLMPIEHRAPFFDLRVVSYLLAIALPWSFNKGPLRSAMTGLLPDSICRRPKTGLADFNYAALLRQGSAQIDRFRAVPELAEYVIRERIPPILANSDEFAFQINRRPLSLNYWLSTRNDCVNSWRKSLGGAGKELDRPTAASDRSTSRLRRKNRVDIHSTGG